MKSEDLNKWRIQNGYSQTDLAEALGVTKLTIVRWGTGERKIPPFLHLALKSLPTKGGEIKRGRPASTGSTTKMKKERKLKRSGNALSKR